MLKSILHLEIMNLLSLPENIIAMLSFSHVLKGPTNMRQGVTNG